MAVVFYYEDHEPPQFHVCAADFAARILIRDEAICFTGCWVRTDDESKLSCRTV